MVSWKKTQKPWVKFFSYLCEHALYMGVVKTIKEVTSIKFQLTNSYSTTYITHIIHHKLIKSKRFVYYVNKPMFTSEISVNFLRHLVWLIHIRCYRHKINNESRAAPRGKLVQHTDLQLGTLLPHNYLTVTSFVLWDVWWCWRFFFPPCLIMSPVEEQNNIKREKK